MADPYPRPPAAPPLAVAPDGGTPPDAEQLAQRLAVGLPAAGVVLAAAARASLATQLAQAQEQLQARRQHLATSQYWSPSDILGWLVAARDAGEADEALWRGFLAAHFGRTSADDTRPAQVASAGQLLCGWGSTPVWTWQRITADFAAGATWLQDHAGELATLQFGRHRHYESSRPAALARLLANFVTWVEWAGGTPVQAFATPGRDSPAARFDVLYQRLSGLARFGRTGRYDLLCLLGDAGLLPISPGSCYLAGSTGPVRGAQHLWGRLAPEVLNQQADQLARDLGLPIQVVEDALDHWPA